MHKIAHYSLVGALSFILLTGCVGHSLDNRTVGTAVGVGAGGLVGSLFGGGSGKIATTIVGAALGGLIGGAVGQNMDETDRMRSSQALEGVPTGQTYAWTNPDTGDQYALTPTETYYPKSSDQPCREFTTAAIINGEEQQVVGNACRQADGSWNAQ